MSNEDYTRSGAARASGSIPYRNWAGRAPLTGVLLLGVILFGCKGESDQPRKPSLDTQNEATAIWPRFRGPGGLGLSGDEGTPTSWNGSAEGMENILWKSAVPYPGHSSPVVWGDRIFITGYDKSDHCGHVLCYEAGMGTLSWQKKVETERAEDFAPPDPLFDEAVGAASTMALDGRRAYAVFANGDLGAFDFEGNPIWARPLGVPKSMYGYASSLAMHQDLLLVQYDQGMAGEDRFGSKLYAIHGESGEIAWEKDRPVVDSWTSPIVIETDKGSQLITIGCPWYIAYDPATGEEIWKVYMEGTDMAPSPIFAAGLVFALVPNYDMCAIRTDGAGDVTESHIAWVRDENIPDVASPVADDELLFLLCNGLLTCCETKSGDMIWQRELDADFQSSPTLVKDKLYLLGADGTMFIVARDREFKEVGRAALGEATSCSPAFVNDRIYIRGEGHLFCVGKK